MRLRIALLVAMLAAAAAPANASAALFFLLSKTSAAPNDRVIVRTGGTPTSFTLSQRIKPFQRPIRLYLVRNELAAAVRSRFDGQLEFVGSLVPDRNGRGILTFSVPSLEPGTYTVAYWCPGCAPYSRGHTFGVQQVDQWVEPYRSHALLRIETRRACPRTIPNGNKPPGQPRGVSWYGNGLLWAAIPRDGAYSVSSKDVEADGSVFDKLLWATSLREGAPKVSGRRLDFPVPPLRVLTVRLGSFSAASKPSWATAVVFRTPGCWRISARVADVRLTYVVEVAVNQR